MSLFSSTKLRSSVCSSPISASLERRLEAVKETRANSLRLEETKEKIRKAFDKVELSVSAYDTAWVAMVPTSSSQSAPLFPQCVNWLLDNQHYDGSWGLDHRHHSLMKDALSSTLACILALKKWGTGERQIGKGLQFIESNSASITDELQHTPAGFDMIFPGMIEYARGFNLTIPLESAVVDALIRKRDSVLKSDSEGISKGREAYLAYILEGLGKLQGGEWILKYQRKNGSLFNSPATTAAAFGLLKNDGCLHYLRSLLKKFKDAVPTVYPFDQYVRLSMVDTLESLGVDRYFKNEIRRVLDETYRCWLQGDEEICLDLTICALAFRLLCAHGYDVCLDPIIPFAEESHFFDSLNGYMKDTGSVLQLFKAVQTYPDESDLNNQSSWTSQYLKMESSNWSINEDRLDTYLKQEVEHVLKFPFYASLERLAHRRKLRGSYVDNTRVMKTSYCSQNICNPDFLKLAVDDFNFCQSIQLEELELLERWVVEKRLDKLKFARQKLAYCYFSAAATLYPPELSDARISWAKNGVLTTVVDDFFDVGGSKEEMANLIYLVERRWDLDDTPLYCSSQVEIIFSALQDTILEIRDKAYTYQGRDVTDHVIEIWLALLKSMQREAEWSSNKSVPTVEDYMANGYVSFALGPIVLPAIYLIGPEISKDAIKSTEFSKLYELMSTIGRLLNDIQSFERESKEGKLNAVSLQMIHRNKEGCSQDELIETLKHLVKTKRAELQKSVMETKRSVVPRECKDVFWKMSKVLNFFYMNNDGFTSQDLLSAVHSVIYEPVSLPESLPQPADP